MAHTPSRHNEPWTLEEIKQLEEFANRNTPADAIAMELGRTQEAVRSKAYKENISLSTASDESLTEGATGYISQAVAEAKRCVREQPGSAMLITAAAGIILGLFLGGRQQKPTRRKFTNRAFARIEEAFNKGLAHKRASF